MSLEPHVVLLLIPGAEFVDGWTGAPNAVATVAGTRSLSSSAAIAVASVFTLIGVMSGKAVATTIGMGLRFAGARLETTFGGTCPAAAGAPGGQNEEE